MIRIIKIAVTLSLFLFLNNKAQATCTNSPSLWPSISSNPVVKFSSVTDGSTCVHKVVPYNVSFESGSIVKRPNYGELIQINMYTFEYTPKKGFKGKDSFSFKVCGTEQNGGKGCVTKENEVTIDCNNCSTIVSENKTNQQNTIKINNEIELAKAKTETERARAEAERARAEAERNKSNFSVPSVIISTPPSTVIVTNDNATAVNRRIADLDAQINLLEGVIKEQRELKKNENNDNQPAINSTIIAVQSRVDLLKREYSERNQNFTKYLTSIKPNDKELYLTSRKASEIYPKIPYYIPGTSETGEFWVEPVVTDRGEMNFSFKFVDLASSIEKVRGKIDMTLAEMEDTQKALFKLHSWSATAHEQKIRKNYEKRVTCFPAIECPPDGERLDGKASTEVRFNIYEDGSTAGRIQRNKGRFIEGYNMSIDSAMLLQAYLNHVITEAKLEFKSGTQDKKSLDQMFK